MAELICPHCRTKLERVWFNITSGWEEWFIQDGQLEYDEYVADEANGPYCHECDRLVGEYLTDMAIEW